MNKLYVPILIVVVVLIAALSAWYVRRTPAEPSFRAEPSKPEVLDLIRVSSPKPGGQIASPLSITGEARGNWFFEASFPVTLTNWDGLIIAEHYATAQGEWMTTEFVPFEATLDFTKPPCMANADYCKRGFLILHKDNPSGLPENDAAIEIPVFFE
jgi:hypothetical protein